MPKFPQGMTERLFLARKIAAGIVDNPGDYPNPPFDAALLESLIAEVMADIANEQELKAQAYAAGEKRRGTFAALVKEMRRLLSLAQAEHRQEAAKLEAIGWNKRAEPKSLPPGQARNLRVLHQGAGTVDLAWQAPEVTAHTGKVGGYLVERQITDEKTREITEEFGQWSFFSYKNKTRLEHQPRGVEIEYRITASNLNGEGPPSNVEFVVL